MDCEGELIEITGMSKNVEFKECDAVGQVKSEVNVMMQKLMTRIFDEMLTLLYIFCFSTDSHHLTCHRNYRQRRRIPPSRPLLTLLDTKTSSPSRPSSQ